MDKPNNTSDDSWSAPNIMNGIYSGIIIIVLYIPALLLPKVSALIADPINTIPGDPAKTFVTIFKLS